MKRKYKHILFLSLYLLFLGISLKSLASYVTLIYASSKGDVAKFSVTESVKDIPLDLGSLNGFNTLTYTFKVTNQDEKLNETHYKYRFYLTTGKNLPLTFSLTHVASENILKSDLTTDYIDISYTSYEEKEYVLHISLEDSSYLNSNKIDYVDLHFEAIQVD